MPAATRYPNAIATAATFLRAALITAGRPRPVASQVPSPMPADREFVRVTRTGGPEVLPVVDGAMLTFDCWAQHEHLAWELAELSRGIVKKMPRAGAAHRVVDLGGTYFNPDPTSGTPRVSFTLQVQLRGVAA